MKIGDTVYIIESNMYVRQAKLKRQSGNLVLVKFDDRSGIQIPKSRLFESKEKALKSIGKRYEEKYNAQLL